MMPDGAATFLSVAQRWYENRESSLDAAHSQRVWSRLERDVFPALGSKMMHEITPPDVLEMIRKIEARGALDISRRAKQGVGQIFQFAIACGLVSSDPTTHMRGGSGRKSPHDDEPRPPPNLHHLDGRDLYGG
jgi:integrase